jgi:signal transduction histidine kinase
MDFRAQSSLYAAIVALAVAVAILLRARRSRLQLLFASLSLNLFLWRALAFLYPITEMPIWARAEFVVACFLPVTALRFYLAFPEEWERRAPAAIFIADLVSVGFAAVAALTPLHQNRIFGAIVVVYVFTVLYLCSYLVYRQYRRIRNEQEAVRLKYLFGGGFIATTLALLDHLPTYVPALGNIAILIYLFLLYQTIIRHRLLDLNEFLGRGLVLGVLALLLAAGYSIIVLWSADYLPLAFLNATIASLLIIIVFDPLRTAVEDLASRFLFRQTYELERRLTTLRREMANIIELRDLWSLILRTLEESRRATHAAIFLLADDGLAFIVAGSHGPPPPERIEIAKERPLIDALRIYAEPIVRENVEREIEDRELGVRRSDPSEIERLREVLAAMTRLHATLLIPLISEDTVLGFFCLMDERLREAYSPAEIALLRRVAAQAVINIENSRLYERIKERDRLAALGEMAAGLAHEIRNPLGAIKGAAQYLAVEPGQPGADFLQIIVEEVNRLNHVVSQFLDYARPYRGQMAPVDLCDLARRTAQLVDVPERKPPVEIALELDESLPPVPADAQLLKQVFLNLALNAIEAMPTGGKLTLRARRLYDGEASRIDGPGVGVEVSDTGEGISQRDLKSIFIPFFTTKERGTGLGLAICQRIVESHGGQILVRSRKGLGTTFVVALPLDAREPAPLPVA